MRAPYVRLFAARNMIARFPWKEVSSNLLLYIRVDALGMENLAHASPANENAVSSIGPTSLLNANRTGEQC